ncbi:hypothetical protein Tco_0896541, partial [Tanacetum coccineum]
MSRLLLLLLRIKIYGSHLLILSAYAPSMSPLLSLPLSMACNDSDGCVTMAIEKDEIIHSLALQRIAFAAMEGKHGRIAALNALNAKNGPTWMQSWWYDARRRGSAFSLLRSGAFYHHDRSMTLISSLPPFMVHVDVDRFLTIESWLGVTMPLGLKEVATSLLTHVCVAAVKPQSQSTDVVDSCRIGVATNVIFGLALGWKSVIKCSFCSSADTTEGRMKDTESSTLHVVMKVGEIRPLSLPHNVNRMALLISLCKVCLNFANVMIELPQIIHMSSFRAGREKGQMGLFKTGNFVQPEWVECVMDCLL